MGYVRFLLALSVFLVHAKAPISISGFGGANSVESFFLISGYLIASVLQKSYSSKRNFYVNRFLRIFPIYWIVLFLTIVIVKMNDQNGIFFSNIKQESWNVIYYLFLIFINLFIIGSDLLAFTNVSSDGVFHFVGFQNTEVIGTKYLYVAPIWSVSLELLFYLIAPLLVKITTKNLCVMASILFSVRFLAFILGLNQDPWTYRFFPFELPVFIFGILLFRFSASIKIKSKYEKFFEVLTHPLGIALCYGLYGLIRSQINSPRFLEIFCLMMYFSLVILFSKKNRWNDILGEYSYPIYIVHFPAIIFLEKWHESFIKMFWQNQIIWISFELIVILFISFILVRISKPIEKIRDRNRVQI